MGTMNPLEDRSMLPGLALLNAACFATVSLAAPALADSGEAYISSATPDPLVVLGDGQNYTKLDTPIIGDFLLKGRLKFEVGSVGGVKSWVAWPYIATGYGIFQEIEGLKTYKVSKSYGVGSRPDKIDKQIEFWIPYSVIEGFAVSMCQWKAHSLRDQGKSDAEIFAKTHEVSFDIDMRATVDSTGAGSGNQVWEASSFELPVRCQKWAGVQVPQGGNGGLADPFRVLTATLKLTEETTANGVCRVKTVTALRANRAGETIKYRFFHSSGKKSAVFSIKTEANKIAVINRSWDIPNEAGAESGWLWVEGVGTKFTTDKVTYGMECSEAAPGGKVLGN
jgi:hypothetical protein